MLYLKNKIGMLLLLVTFSALYGNNQSRYNASLINQCFSKIGSSKVSYWLDRVILAKACSHLASTFNFDEPASSTYQELGKEAQIAVGIPEEHQVPIKKFPASMTAIQIGGATVPGAIYVNEDRMKSVSYGAQRCTLFHEAVHRKYNDVTFSFLLELGSLSASFIFARKMLLKFSNLGLLYYPLLAGTTYGSMYLVMLAHSKYIERRADREGHYASQCHICVKESAERRRYIFEIEKNPIRNNGYLSAEALEAIAKDLEKENKVCRHHIMAKLA